jgi:peptide deformylase
MTVTVRPIIRAGDPLLAKAALPVADPAADAVARLVADMIDTLDSVGVAGIAAPQIGVSERVVIYFVPEHRVSERPGDDPIGLTVLVNPEVHPVGDGMYTDWEGCLSLPDMRGRVPRWEKVRLVASDLDGRRTERLVAGTHARIVQHECDHLDGRLYPSRMVDLASFGYLDELVRSGQLPPRVPVRPKDYLRGQDAVLTRLARAGVPLA